MKDVHELSLVLLQTFYLNIEDGTRVNVDSVVFLDVLRKTDLVLVLNVHEFLLALLIIHINRKLFNIGEICDPLISDLVGHPVCKQRVAMKQEFMNIKYQNKIRLAKYIKEHNGIDVDPRSIFDVQVKRLHEYKRQLMNILHVMYLYNQLKDNPNMDIVPRTFIFGAKAAAGYKRAKLTIKLINNVANVINNDKSIGGKLKVVFIEDYRVSNAELIFSAADVSEQISTEVRKRPVPAT